MTDVPAAVVRKLTYTYYHDWVTDDPEYVFLLADPGTPGEHVVMEVNAYAERLDSDDIRDVLQVDQRFGTRWLASGRYTAFTKEFVEGCDDAGLIDSTEPWWRYLLSGRFFNDFYMRDVIKYRDADVRAGDIDAAFDQYLKAELEYVDPTVVFAFGNRARGWARFRSVSHPTAPGLRPSTATSTRRPVASRRIFSRWDT